MGSLVTTMTSHRAEHRQSFMQMAKALLRFRGKTKREEQSEERSRKHKYLRKTVSLSSSYIGSMHGQSVWFDPGPHEKNYKSDAPDKFPVFKTEATKRTPGNLFKPKYHSQKIKSARDSSQTSMPYLLSKHTGKLNHPPEKPGRRKFSLKVVGDGRGRLERRDQNLSCPDLAGAGLEKRNRGRSAEKKNIGGADVVDTLDMNTVDMFSEKQSFETGL